MMLVKLSSKGQLVIPNAIRQSLNLKAGTELSVVVDAGKIILQPVMNKHKLQVLIADIQDLAKGESLFADLEEERRREQKKEARLAQTFSP